MKQRITQMVLCALVISLGAWRSTQPEPKAATVVAPTHETATVTAKDPQPATMLYAMGFIKSALIDRNDETAELVRQSLWLGVPEDENDPVCTDIRQDCDGNFFELRRLPDCQTDSEGNALSCGTCPVTGEPRVRIGGIETCCVGFIPCKERPRCVILCETPSCPSGFYSDWQDYCDTVEVDPCRFLTW